VIKYLKSCEFSKRNATVFRVGGSILFFRFSLSFLEHRHFLVDAVYDYAIKGWLSATSNDPVVLPRQVRIKKSTNKANQIIMKSML
jgi:hypothetical protein